MFHQARNRGIYNGAAQKALLFLPEGLRLDGEVKRRDTHMTEVTAWIFNFTVSDLLRRG